MRKEDSIYQVNPKYPGLLNQFINIRGQKFSIWSIGPINPKRITVLAISGWSHSAYTMTLLQKLLNESIQFVGIDIPGFIGYSEKPKYNYTLEKLTEYLVEIPIAMKLKKFGLLGFSIGGLFQVSTYLKLKNNRKWSPKFMILIAPALVGEKIQYGNKYSSIIKLKIANILAETKDLRKTVEEITSGKLIKILLMTDIFYKDKTNSLPKELSDLFMASTTDQLENIDTKLLTDTALDLIKNDRSGLLKELDIPTLLITGSNDNTTPTVVTRSLLPFIKDGEYNEIENEDHDVIVTNPKALNDIIIEFLRKRRFIK